MKTIGTVSRERLCLWLLAGGWLLLCLPWLPAHLGTEVAAWQRFFHTTPQLFVDSMSGGERFLDDVRKSIPAGSRVTLVGGNPLPGEISGTYFHLYPSQVRWGLVGDGFPAAARDAQFVVLTTTQPLQATGDTRNLLWTRAYPATAVNPAFNVALMRGGLPLPPPDSWHTAPPKFIAPAAPLRTATGFLVFALLAAAAGAGALRLLGPTSLNALEKTGLVLLLGILGVPAVVVVMMLAGVGLSTGFVLVVAAILAATVVAARHRPRSLAGPTGPTCPIGPTSQTSPTIPSLPAAVPWWLWLLLAAGLGRPLLACQFPAYSWDTWMIWLLKARVLWIDDGLNGPFWQWLEQLWECHPAYPLTWPAAGALAGVFAGAPDAYVFNWTGQLLTVGGLFLVAGTALRHHGARLAAGATALFLLMPVLWNSKDFGLADLPLMVTEFAAVALLAAARREREPRLLWLAWFLTALAAVVKLEGVLFLACWLAVTCTLAATSWWRSRQDPAPPPAMPRRVRMRWALAWLAPLLLLAWYAVPILRHFPDDRWRNAPPGGALANLHHLPAVTQRLAVALVNPALPHALVPAPLPTGRTWHLDEVLFHGSAYQLLHLPLLGAGLLLWLLLFHRPAWRQWLPVWGVFLLLLCAYPLLYLPKPADLPASLQRLAMQLTAVLAAILITQWPRRTYTYRP